MDFIYLQIARARAHDLHQDAERSRLSRAAQVSRGRAARPYRPGRNHASGRAIRAWFLRGQLGPAQDCLPRA